MDFPDIQPDQYDVGIETNTETFEAELNGASQYGQLPGDRWEVTATWTNRGGSEARQLRGFVYGLRGPATLVSIQPFDIDQQGTMAGSGVVNGADQTGTTLTTSGWGIDQSALFEPGDYFEAGGQLKVITETISSDGTGAATLVFAPPLRNSPADASPIEVDNPRMDARLTGDGMTRAQVSSPLIYALTLTFREDIT